MKRLGMLVLCCLLGGAGPVRGETLRVATEGAYRPFNYFNNQGELSGFDVDVARALCAEMKVDCQFSAIKWEDLIPAVEQGRVDMIVAAMSKTPERLARVEFTDSYVRARSVFLARADGKPAANDVAATRKRVAGLRVAAQGGTIQADLLGRHFQDKVTVTQLPTLDEVLAALKTRKVDAVVVENLVAYDFLSGMDGTAYGIVGVLQEENDETSKAYIQVRKGNAGLRQSINQALRAIWLNGTYRKISEKYFPFEIY